MHAIATVRTFGVGLLVAASLLLVGCSESKETLAAKACLEEFGRKVQQESPDRPFAGDIAAIASTAKDDADGIMHLSSEAMLDAGQANEARQRFTCRVQFDPAKPDAPPEVILLQFDF